MLLIAGPFQSTAKKVQGAATRHSTRQRDGMCDVCLCRGLKNPNQNANIDVVMRILQTEKVSNRIVLTCKKQASPQP